MKAVDAPPEDGEAAYLLDHSRGTILLSRGRGLLGTDHRSEAYVPLEAPLVVPRPSRTTRHPERRLMAVMAERPVDRRTHSPADLVRLLDAEPDFGAGVETAQLEDARRRTLAPVVTVAPGAWDPEDLTTSDEVTGPFAALVLSGLLVRECCLADRRTSQLVGPGDVIPLRAPDERLPVATYHCRAATETRVAVLDQRFLAAAQRWPWLTARMAERTVRWADRALTLQAISQLGRVDARIVALLWHLAERWGRVTSQGLVVPLKLTHEGIGTLVGAQRPTVSLALKDLREQGAVQPYGAAWLLSAESRELVTAGAPGQARPSAPFDVVPRTDFVVDSQDGASDRLVRFGRSPVHGDAHGGASPVRALSA